MTQRVNYSSFSSAFSFHLLTHQQWTSSLYSPPPSVEKRKVFFIDSGSLHRFVKNNQCSVQAEIHHLTAASIVHKAVLPDEMLFLSNERAWPACFWSLKTVAFTYWSFSHGHVWALFSGTGLHQPGSLLVLQVLILNEYTFMTCVLYSQVDVFLWAVGPCVELWEQLCILGPAVNVKRWPSGYKPTFLTFRPDISRISLLAGFLYLAWHTASGNTANPHSNKPQRDFEILF